MLTWLLLALLPPTGARIIVYQPHIFLRGGGAMSLVQLHQTLLSSGFDTVMYALHHASEQPTPR